MTNEITDTSDLTRLLVEALEECCQRGMSPPFIMCGISPNGSICSVRMTGEDDGQVLAEHYEGEGSRCP